jgi:ABC-2 type transport system permease protein
MSTLSYAVADSATMLCRQLRHMQRYLSVTVFLIGMPIVFLLLFVYVFGGTLGAGLGGPSGGRAEYLEFVVPGILLIAVAAGGTGTAISVATDMTEGIVARFRTMAIYRPSVLAGHVLGSMIQTMLSLAVVLGVALLIGFRPNATPVEWVAAAGILAFITLALTWLCVAFGLVTKTVEAANNLPTPPGIPAVPRQRVRPPRVDADRAALVRRVPALHPGHRHRAGAAGGHRYRQQRGHRRRLVRGHHPGRLPLGQEVVQPRPHPVARRQGRSRAARAARAAARRSPRPRPAYDDTASS